MVAAGLRHDDGRRAPPAPLRGQQRLPRASSRRRGCVFAGTSPGRHAGGVRRAARRRAPVLRRRPRPTRSSSRARTGPTRCSPGWSGPPSTRSGRRGWSRSSARSPRRWPPRDAGRPDRSHRRAGRPPRAAPGRGERAGVRRHGLGRRPRHRRPRRGRRRCAASTSSTPAPSCIVALDDARPGPAHPAVPPPGRRLRVGAARGPAGRRTASRRGTAAARELHEEADLEAARVGRPDRLLRLAGRGQRGAAGLPGPRPVRRARTTTGTAARARSSACRCAGSTSTRPTRRCSRGQLHNPGALIGILAAHAARARDWSTLRPHDTGWPEHPAYR